MKIKLEKRISVNEYRAIEYYAIQIGDQSASVDLDNIDFEELDWNYPHLVKDGKPVVADELITTYEYNSEEEFIKAGFFDALERKVLKMLATAE